MLEWGWEFTFNQKRDLLTLLTSLQIVWKRLGLEKYLQGSAHILYGFSQNQFLRSQLFL